MSWNHRVVRHSQGGKTWFGIHEVYYDDNGKIKFWTENPVKPMGGTLKELQEELAMFSDAAGKAMARNDTDRVLDETELPNYKAEPEGDIPHCDSE